MVCQGLQIPPSFQLRRRLDPNKLQLREANLRGCVWRSVHLCMSYTLRWVLCLKQWFSSCGLTELVTVDSGGWNLGPGLTRSELWICIVGRGLPTVGVHSIRPPGAASLLIVTLLSCWYQEVHRKKKGGKALDLLPPTLLPILRSIRRK